MCIEYATKIGFSIIRALISLSVVYDFVCSLNATPRGKNNVENRMDLSSRNPNSNLVKLIKLDCGELCSTSIDAEKTIHKGKIHYV